MNLENEPVLKNQPPNPFSHDQKCGTERERHCYCFHVKIGRAERRVISKVDMKLDESAF